MIVSKEKLDIYIPRQVKESLQSAVENYASYVQSFGHDLCGYMSSFNQVKYKVLAMKEFYDEEEMFVFQQIAAGLLIEELEKQKLIEITLGVFLDKVCQIKSLFNGVHEITYEYFEVDLPKKQNIDDNTYYIGYGPRRFSYGVRIKENFEQTKDWNKTRKDEFGNGILEYSAEKKGFRRFSKDKKHNYLFKIGNDGFIEVVNIYEEEEK